jgi:hypothetical protein
MGNKSSDNASLPQRPNYKDKNERMTIELSSRLFSKTGSLLKVNIKKYTQCQSYSKVIYSPILPTTCKVGATTALNTGS